MVDKKHSPDRRRLITGLGTLAAVNALPGRLAAQAGIAGSAKIGNDVTLAGQSGVINHVKIGDGSIVAVKSCVFKSIKPNSFVSGIPARNHSERLKQEAIINKLPDIYKKIKN